MLSNSYRRREAAMTRVVIVVAVVVALCARLCQRDCASLGASEGEVSLKGRAARGQARRQSSRVSRAIVDKAQNNKMNSLFQFVVMVCSGISEPKLLQGLHAVRNCILGRLGQGEPSIPPSRRVWSLDRLLVLWL